MTAESAYKDWYSAASQSAAQFLSRQTALKDLACYTAAPVDPAKRDQCPQIAAEITRAWESMATTLRKLATG